MKVGFATMFYDITLSLFVMSLMVRPSPFWRLHTNGDGQGIGKTAEGALANVELRGLARLFARGPSRTQG